MTTTKLQLENSISGSVIVPKLAVASSLWQRTVGLLGTPRLQSGEALWLQPCTGIHTWFMQYSIDVLFLDKHGKVLRTVENLRPFRIAGPLLRARTVVEMAPGTLKHVSVKPGDILSVVAQPTAISNLQR
jgi:uncharacterized membrane protein (UPF0127 family)